MELVHCHLKADAVETKALARCFCQSDFSVTPGQMVLPRQMVLLTQTALLEPAVPSRRNGMSWRADSALAQLVLLCKVLPCGQLVLRGQMAPARQLVFCVVAPLVALLK